MKQLLISVAAITLIVFSRTATSAGSEKYLCIADQSTGFRWDGKSWVQAAFRVENDRFVVQEIPARPDVFDKNKQNTFVVRRFGSNSDAFDCSRGGNRIICGGLGLGILIDTTRLRYQELYGLGYLDGKDDAGNTPSLTIGKCARLE